MKTLELDPEAWEAGFTAGETGEASSRCPYPATGLEALSWHSGFIEGDAKRQGYGYSRGVLPEAQDQRQGRDGV